MILVWIEGSNRYNIRLSIQTPPQADNFLSSIPLVRNLLCPTEASLHSSGLSLFLFPMSSLLSAATAPPPHTTTPPPHTSTPHHTPPHASTPHYTTSTPHYNTSTSL